MNATVATLEPGAVVENRYRLLERLGGGGMGQVWAAEHLTLGHRVALKILNGGVTNMPEPRARFEREARLMARLGQLSRHITRVFEHGVLEDGTPFLVMELLSGEGLDQALKREKSFSLPRTSELIGQVCKALAIAHQEGVTHRDIKPANIFVTTDEDGQVLVKLLDFGVAKARAEFGEQTVGGTVIGTPNYMAPEQLSGEAPVDHRSDLFALGSVTYRCAVGKPPFGTASLSEMAMRILTMKPRPPSAVNAALSPAFDAFMRKALAKGQAERFQTAREFGAALHEVASGAPAGATPRASSPDVSGVRPSLPEVAPSPWRGSSPDIGPALAPRVYEVLGDEPLATDVGAAPPRGSRQRAARSPGRWQGWLGVVLLLTAAVFVGASFVPPQTMRRAEGHLPPGVVRGLDAATAWLNGVVTRLHGGVGVPPAASRASIPTVVPSATSPGR